GLLLSSFVDLRTTIGIYTLSLRDALPISRDLSSAKGFEQFILIAKAILAVRPNVRFVFCGSPKVLYSYEGAFLQAQFPDDATRPDRKSTRLNSSHVKISYADFCVKQKN